MTLGNTTQPLPASVKVELGLANHSGERKQLRVNYRAQVSSTGTTTPVATPKTVVSLKPSQRPRTTRRTRISSKLDRSLSSYLSAASAQ